MTFKRFILDVDGVLNDGKIYWGPEGKLFKAFGNYDHDGLKILRNYLDISFITADLAGWEIIKTRIVDHMKFELNLVKEKDRMKWILDKGNIEDTIFMGDGPYDALIFQKVGLGIAPANAWNSAINKAHYVTKRKGGGGAVMEACVHILNILGVKNDF